MSERLYTEGQALELAVRAVQIAMAQEPKPATISAAEAARLLDVSVRTIHRWNPPKVAGMVPYAWVLKKMQLGGPSTIA